MWDFAFSSLRADSDVMGDARTRPRAEAHAQEDLQASL